MTEERNSPCSCTLGGCDPHCNLHGDGLIKQEKKGGEEMKRLMNIQHSFDLKVGDVGCTIRRGSKWSKVPVGTELELWNCPKAHPGECTEQPLPGLQVACKCEGKGKILGSWMGKFIRLPDNLLSIEHNNQCKDFDALTDMMVRAYPDIKLGDIVTALIYERVK